MLSFFFLLWTSLHCQQPLSNLPHPPHTPTPPSRRRAKWYKHISRACHPCLVSPKCKHGHNKWRRAEPGRVMGAGSEAATSWAIKGLFDAPDEALAITWSRPSAASFPLSASRLLCSQRPQCEAWLRQEGARRRRWQDFGNLLSLGFHCQQHLL